MSDNQQTTPAEILIRSAVQTVGKREFLKTVERIFGLGQKQVSSKQRKQRTKQVVASAEQCAARVKGARTGIKIGRFVLFEAARCDRKQVDGSTHLCAIHTNQVKKMGALPFGIASEPLTEEQAKTFVPLV